MFPLFQILFSLRIFTQGYNIRRSFGQAGDLSSSSPSLVTLFLTGSRAFYFVFFLHDPI
jgi:hypothetical protein